MKVTKTRRFPTPAVGDEEGLSAARAARRRILASIAAAAAAAAAAAVPGVGRAQGRAATPPQPAGPFYPSTFPEDVDNDLVAVKGAAGFAKGELLFLTGIVVDTGGRPLVGARVEIWQCNAAGRYHHPGDTQPAPLDPGFQGYGFYTTRADGAYDFRTIRPVPYPGRTPHIHFRVSGPGMRTLVTQMYVAGEPGNARDFLYNTLRDDAEKRAVTVDLARAADGKAYAGRFEIVLRT